VDGLEQEAAAVIVDIGATLGRAARHAHRPAPREPTGEFRGHSILQGESKEAWPAAHEHTRTSWMPEQYEVHRAPCNAGTESGDPLVLAASSTRRTNGAGRKRKAAPKPSRNPKRQHARAANRPTRQTQPASVAASGPTIWRQQRRDCMPAGRDGGSCCHQRQEPGLPPFRPFQTLEQGCHPRLPARRAARRPPTSCRRAATTAATARAARGRATAPTLARAADVTALACDAGCRNRTPNCQWRAAKTLFSI